MIKLIWISDSSIKGIIFWFFKKVLESGFSNDVRGIDAEEVIEDEGGDFFYLNFKKPANADVMERLCINNYNCLRVSVLLLNLQDGHNKIFLPYRNTKIIARA